MVGRVNVMYILPQFLTSAQGKHVTSVTKWRHDSSKKTTFPLGFTGETEPTGYMDPQKKISLPGLGTVLRISSAMICCLQAGKLVV